MMEYEVRTLSNIVGMEEIQQEFNLLKRPSLWNQVNIRAPLLMASWVKEEKGPWGKGHNSHNGSKCRTTPMICDIHFLALPDGLERKI